MSLTLDGTASARIATPVRGAAWLVEMDFAGGTFRYTTAGQPVTVAGNVYTALGTLAEVANLVESANSSAERLTFSLSITSSAQLGASMGDPATYRGRAARLYLQLFDEAFQPAGAPVLRWSGYMDKVQISRKPSPKTGGAASGRIEMVCSRAGMARARNQEGLRLTDAQQQVRYPGDTGLRYVRKLVEQPTLWLSKKFQEI